MAKMGSTSQAASEPTEVYMPSGSADRFTKVRIIGSGKYKKSDLDVLQALLKEDESYTLNEVTDMLQKFKAEKV